MGKTVLDLPGWLDTLGGEVAARDDMAGAFCGLCHGRTDLRCVDGVDGFCL